MKVRLKPDTTYYTEVETALASRCRSAGQPRSEALHLNASGTGRHAERPAVSRVGGERHLHRRDDPVPGNREGHVRAGRELRDALPQLIGLERRAVEARALAQKTLRPLTFLSIDERLSGRREQRDVRAEQAADEFDRARWGDRYNE